MSGSSSSRELREQGLSMVTPLTPSGLTGALDSWLPADQWSPRDEGVDLWILEWGDQALGCDPPPNLLNRWSPRQLQRYQGIQDSAPRRSWAWTQVALREILGRYLDQRGEDLRILVDTHGRPQLEGLGPSFSLSHCERRVLVAVDPSGAPLGVDLERRDPTRRLQAIVQRFFCAEDQALFFALAASDQLKVFYRWWTQKEALAKADGRGLSSALLRLPFGGNAPSQEFEWGDERWMLWDLGAWGNFQGAIALQASRRRSDFRTFWPMPKELA